METLDRVVVARRSRVRVGLGAAAVLVLTGLVVALAATIMATRPATDAQTFGHRRVEVFAALVNGLILLVVVTVITVEAVIRLSTAQPSHVVAPLMLMIAIVGAVANTIALLVLRGGAKDSSTSR